MKEPSMSINQNHSPFRLLFLSTVLAIVLIGSAATDQADRDMANKIRFEGLKHSQVGKLTAYLSDVIGPRPTGSPEIDRANRWAAAKMKEFGLTNIALEPYADFGVGWALRYVSAHLIQPHYAPLIAISVEWGSSTVGKIARHVAASVASPFMTARAMRRCAYVASAARAARRATRGSAWIPA